MSDSHLLSHSFISHPSTPVLLYLHGFLGCRKDWDEIVSLLGGAFSHLTLDLPGHGPTPLPLPGKSYTMPACAELVIDLLDCLRIERCHLIGYSMGGRLSLYLLAHYPERFLSVVIESASPGLETKKDRQARRFQDDQLRRQLESKPVTEFVHQWYRQPLFQSVDRTDPRFEAMLRRRCDSDPTGLALSLKHMGTGVQPCLWDSLNRLPLPVLFVSGEKDDKYGALADRMANLCPGGRTAIIPGAGHNAHYESPAGFCQEVAPFLRESK